MARPESKEVWACRTYLKWTYDAEDDGLVYKVSLVSSEGQNFKYVCNCKNYDGTCIHILSVKGFHCGWNEVYDSEEMAVDGICPRCGEMAVRIPV